MIVVIAYEYDDEKLKSLLREDLHGSEVVEAIVYEATHEGDYIHTWLVKNKRWGIVKNALTHAVVKRDEDGEN